MFNFREFENNKTHAKWSTIAAAICFALAVGVGVPNLLAQDVYQAIVDKPVNAIELYQGPHNLSNARGSQVLVGGGFKQVGGEPRTSFACLQPNGQLFDALRINLDGSVYSMISQPDGRFLIGGEFGRVNNEERFSIALLDGAGRLDPHFNPNPNPTAAFFALVAQADGKILVGGRFDSIGGQPRNNVARLNPDGTLDTAFNPNANGEIRKIALQSDGKILLGGTFTEIGGQARGNIARLNADGKLDMSFNPNADAGVYSIALQADGQILVGGGFTSIGGQARNRMARLNANGAVDAAFHPNANESVFSIAVQADGKIVAGGAFTEMGGQDRKRIARLNADGTVDAFKVELSGQVYAVLVQPNGKILAGGEFRSVGYLPPDYTTPIERPFIVRLNADGTLD